jgi:endonuclease/exonuclease/phosphatase family metal-dependent hydrolase
MSSTIRLGTYNTNNLFDRFDDPYSFSDDPWQRSFGTKPKKLKDLYSLGARIRTSHIDILAMQEIESLGAVKEFIAGHVGESYKLKGIISMESNDPRGMDLAVISKFPLGRVTSHRFRQHDGRLVFSRDCLQVEIMHPDRKEVLLTLFNCHLKSKYSRYLPGTAEYLKDQQHSLNRRKRQVEHTIKIIKAYQDVNTDRFVVLGDMNDTPDSPALNDFLRPKNTLHLYNALESITQDDTTVNSTKLRPRDTHQWEKAPESGHPETTYSQLDYILISKALKNVFTGSAKVEQRQFTTGSDHYLCWIELNLNLL